MKEVKIRHLDYRGKTSKPEEIMADLLCKCGSIGASERSQIHLECATKSAIIETLTCPECEGVRSIVSVGPAHTRGVNQ